MRNSDQGCFLLLSRCRGMTCSLTYSLQNGFILWTEKNHTCFCSGLLKAPHSTTKDRQALDAFRKSYAARATRAFRGKAAAEIDAPLGLGNFISHLLIYAKPHRAQRLSHPLRVAHLHTKKFPLCQEHLFCRPGCEHFNHDSESCHMYYAS